MKTWPSKRADENDFRGVDWRTDLGVTETIVSFDFLLPTDSDLVLEDKSLDGTKVIARLSGGVAGTKPLVISRISTSATPPRVLELPIELPIE